MQTRPAASSLFRSLPLLCLAAISVVSSAQPPHPLTPADSQAIDALIHKMTLEQKLDYIGGTGFAIRAIPSLNLPALEMSDGPYGTRSNAGLPSGTYAAGVGLAASWDRQLAAKVGGAIGRDARARGVHFMLGPGVNIYRSPRNGRNFEYFGEDPFLSAAITTGYITGMQQQGVSATVKHYAGNNSEFLRHDSNSIIDERTLREIYLPAFEAAVKDAHVGAIMDSYNLLNGQHATQNTHLNIDIARHDWKFPGVMMSDWSATYDPVAAANGGLDLEMPTGKFMNRANLQHAVEAGTVSQATLDDKIRHILTTAFAFDWFKRPQLDPTISYFDKANQDVALQSARESAVLLKNDGALLPLNPASMKRILVVGPNAYPGSPVGGGSAGVVPFHIVSPLEGISDRLGSSVAVLYDRGLPTLSQLARATCFTTAAVNGKPGLTHDSFSTEDLSGTPASSFTLPFLDNPGAGRGGITDNPEIAAVLASSRHPSTRYIGFYNAQTAGRYIVALESSGEGGGTRVLVDDKLLIDNWDRARAFQPHVTLDLPAGTHKIVVEEHHRGTLGPRLRLAIAREDSIVTPRARELAATSDAVVIAAGFLPESEGEGGDRTFALPFGQDALIRAISQANPRTIVAVTSGGNFDSTSWLDHVPALLETWYAGQEGGRALAEIIFGDVNPSGHLPATYERRAEDNPTYSNYYTEPGSISIPYKEGIFVGYRGYEHNHVQPLFPFGFGLSYTTFQFANLKVTASGSASSPPALVTFDVTNTGKRPGAQVAQVYVAPSAPSVPRPARELKGFDRVELAPGETRHIELTLDARAFAFFNAQNNKWTVDPGRYTIYVGDSVLTTPLHESIDLKQRTELPLD